jgi:hypothetical protein
MMRIDTCMSESAWGEVERNWHSTPTLHSYTHTAGRTTRGT